MKLGFSLIILLYSMTSFAQGGSGVGNGGSGVVCYQLVNGKKIASKAYSLDLWEATHESNRLKVDLGSLSLSPFEKVEIMIGRVRKVDPAFASILVQKFDVFKRSYEVQARVAIKEIDDTKTLVTPKGNCEIYQIAVQKRVVDTYFDKKFLFDADAWKFMDNDERAGLIFHEILYWTEIELGVNDSFGVRRLVGVFASQFGSDIPLSEYLSLLKKHSAREYYDYHGLSLSIKSPVLFDTEGNLSQASLGQVTDVVFSKGHTRLHFKTQPKAIYQMNPNGEILGGPLSLIQIEVNYLEQKMTYLFSGVFALNGDYTQIDANVLAEARSVVVNRADWNASLELPMDLARKWVRPDGTLSVIASNRPDLFRFLSVFKIRLENAEFAGLVFSEDRQIIGVLVQVDKMGSLYDDSVVNGRHELSWKPSGIYEVTLDFEKNAVKSIR